MRSTNALRGFRKGFGDVAVAACLTSLAAAFVGALMFAPFVEAQDKKVQTTPPCAPGFELRLSASEARQGGLLLAEVRSTQALEELKGEWSGRAVEFWRANSGGNSRREVRRALLGVDLERPSGSYNISIQARTQSGEPVSCSAPVTVKAAKFATEKLQVEKQFVEPNAEQLKRAEEERQRLREIFARVTPERLWLGRFRLPLDGARTASNFGRRRVLNGQPGSPHSGADFPAVTGTPVHAAQGGRVVMAEPLFFSGNTLLIDHGLGVYTFYGHLEEISVKAGQLVKAGAIVGKVGATGRVTGPHLHWGLTVNGARVNPVQIVQLARIK